MKYEEVGLLEQHLMVRLLERAVDLVFLHRKEKYL